MTERYYLRNKERGCVGNSCLWWAKSDRGYVCDIRAAKEFTKEQADEHCKYGKFSMHLVSDIKPIVQHHIDIQDLQAKRTKPHSLMSMAELVNED